MATRSTIALEFADGTIGQVYCHSDGYLSYNGKVLLQHYTDPFKLQKLIDNGDLSFLGIDIGTKIDYNSRIQYNSTHQAIQCCFYGRDRDQEDVSARYFKDFTDYEQNHQYEEFEYILRTDGVWYVNQGNKYEPLMEALVEDLRQEAEEE